MRLACLQFRPEWGRSEANLDQAARLLDTLPPDPTQGLGPRIAVLPELATTGYVFLDRTELLGLAEPVPDGPSCRRLLALARNTGWHLAMGLAERAGDQVYNGAVLVGPKGLVGIYRKVHLFDRETRVFDPGDLGLPVFDVDGVGVGLMVCYDWFFPESMRSLVLGGAQVILHPSNLVLPWCQRSMPVRCLENHVVAVTTNRTGTEARGDVHLTFTGGSQITGCTGEILARADTTGDAVLDVVIDPTRTLDRRMGDVADTLAHRRPDQYHRSLR
jgi:predicted amidohydrolase